MKVVLFAFLISIVAMPSFAAESISLKWGFVRLPPLAYINDQNIAVGSFVDMLGNIGKQANINFEPSEFPNARALFNINEKKTNFAIGVKSMIKDKDQFVFSKFSFAKLQLMVLWRNGTNPIFDYVQLSNKNLILIQAYTYNGHRNDIETNAANIVTVESHQRAIDALLLKRADYALVYKLAAEFALQDDSINKSNDLTGMVIDEYELYFILDAEFPDAKNLMQKIESTFESSNRG